MTHSIIKIYDQLTGEIIERKEIDTSADRDDLYLVAHMDGHMQQVIEFAAPKFDEFFDDDNPRTYLREGQNYYVPVLGLKEVSEFANRFKRASVEFLPINSGFDWAVTKVLGDKEKPELDVFDLERLRPLGDPTTFLPMPQELEGVEIRPDGYYYYVGKGIRQLTVGFVAVCAVGATLKGASTVDILVKPLGEQLSRITVETAYLNDSKFIEQLAKLGITTVNPKKLIDLLNKQRGILAQFNQKHHLKTDEQLNFVALEQHGWNRVDDAFVFNRGDALITPADLQRRLRLISGQHSKLRVKSSHEEWLDKVFNPVKDNPLILGAMYLALSSSIMEFLPQVQSMTVHYSGESGVAKTSMMQVVSTLFGNGSQSFSSQGDPLYIKKHAATINGLETLFAEYSGFALILDEIGTTDVEFFGHVLYRLTDEQSKQRMGYDQQSWRIVLLSTGEVNIKSLLVKQTSAPAGQFNRLLEIHIDKNVFGATIDEKTRKAEELPWVTELMLNTGRYYGSAGEAFINALVHTENVETMIQDMHRQALARIGNVLQFGEARVLKTIAAAEVVARIASEFGILPVSDEMQLRTIDGLVAAAVQNIKNAPLAVINFIRESLKHGSVGKGIRINGTDDVYLVHNPKRYGVETVLAIRKNAFDLTLSKDELTTVRRELLERHHLIRTNGEHFETIEKQIPIYAIKYTQAFKDVYPDPAFWADFESQAMAGESARNTIIEED